MNKFIKALNDMKIVVFILFTFLLFASCNKGDTEKPESVCTLTPEQLPEVRGFRLGMSYDAIKQRFPNICNYDDNNAGITINLYRSSTENAPSTVNNCASVNIENYPELEGINKITFGLEKRMVKGFTIVYDKTTDENFIYTFQSKIEGLLGLSKFTNWERVSNILEPTRKDYELEGKSINCNKAYISTITVKDVTTPYYKPLLVVTKTDKIAITKAQQEQEKLDEEIQKSTNDAKKRETFKP